MCENLRPAFIKNVKPLEPKLNSQDCAGLRNSPSSSFSIKNTAKILIISYIINHSLNFICRYAPRFAQKVVKLSFSIFQQRKTILVTPFTEADLALLPNAPTHMVILSLEAEFALILKRFLNL